MKKKTEHSEQAAFIAYMRLKKIPCFAIVNAAKRSYKLASYLRAEGLESGVPDVFVPLPKYVIGSGKNFTKYQCGLFIEFKSAKGKLTLRQVEWRGILETNDYRVEVCRSAGEAIKAVEEYLR